MHKYLDTANSIVPKVNKKNSITVRITQYSNKKDLTVVRKIYIFFISTSVHKNNTSNVFKAASAALL